MGAFWGVRGQGSRTPLGRLSLRAQGTLISEPQSSTPCDMRFFPSDTGKLTTLRGSASKWPIFPVSLGKNRISQGVEDWGSLSSVPFRGLGFLRLFGASGFWILLTSVDGRGDSSSILDAILEDRNLLKLRSLGSSFPFFLCDTSI